MPGVVSEDLEAEHRGKGEGLGWWKGDLGAASSKMIRRGLTKDRFLYGLAQVLGRELVGAHFGACNVAQKESRSLKKVKARTRDVCGENSFNRGRIECSEDDEERKVEREKSVRGRK